MTTKTHKQSNWLTKIFQPQTDFYKILHEQSLKTLAGVEALLKWMENTNEENSNAVRALEKEADEIRTSVTTKLAESFVTPFDREDIYDLSELLDEVINDAKATVREFESMELTKTNEFMVEMSKILLEGTRSIEKSFAALKNHPQEATNQAMAARKSEKSFQKAYRRAMHELYSSEDVRSILKTREVYRCMSHAADWIERVAEKLLYVIIKIS